MDKLGEPLGGGAKLTDIWSRGKDLGTYNSSLVPASALRWLPMRCSQPPHTHVAITTSHPHHGDFPYDAVSQINPPPQLCVVFIKYSAPARGRSSDTQHALEQLSWAWAQPFPSSWEASLSPLAPSPPRSFQLSFSSLPLSGVLCHEEQMTYCSQTIYSLYFRNSFP